MADPQVPVATEADWVEELGRLAALVAHEVNNLLNGVAVNLEVVRSRAARSADTADIGPFAETASAQLESLTPVVRSIIALSRPAPESPSISTELNHIVAVVNAVASARGGGVALELAVSETPTCVPGATARLLLASAVRVAAEPGIHVKCSVANLGENTVVRVARQGNRGELPMTVLRAAMDAGVHVEHTGGTLTLRFPAGPPHPSLT